MYQHTMQTPQLAQSLAEKMAHVKKSVSVALITGESSIVPNR